MEYTHTEVFQNEIYSYRDLPKWSPLIQSSSKMESSHTELIQKESLLIQSSSKMESSHTELFQNGVLFIKSSSN